MWKRRIFAVLLVVATGYGIVKIVELTAHLAWNIVLRSQELHDCQSSTMYQSPTLQRILGYGTSDNRCDPYQWHGWFYYHPRPGDGAWSYMIAIALWLILCVFVLSVWRYYHSLRLDEEREERMLAAEGPTGLRQYR